MSGPSNWQHPGTCSGRTASTSPSIPVDDVEYLLTLGTEDNLMIGTDYSHSDVSANVSALNEVRRWADSGMISNEAAGKILEDNPKAFYGL